MFQGGSWSLDGVDQSFSTRVLWNSRVPQKGTGGPWAIDNWQGQDGGQEGKLPWVLVSCEGAAHRAFLPQQCHYSCQLSTGSDKSNLGSRIELREDMGCALSPLQLLPPATAVLLRWDCQIWTMHTHPHFLPAKNVGEGRVSKLCKVPMWQSVVSLS